MARYTQLRHRPDTCVSLLFLFSLMIVQPSFPPTLLPHSLNHTRALPVDSLTVQSEWSLCRLCRLRFNVVQFLISPFSLPGALNGRPSSASRGSTRLCTATRTARRANWCCQACLWPSGRPPEGFRRAVEAGKSGIRRLPGPILHGAYGSGPYFIV